MTMIKTRFAPSPTGYLHVGGLRTALFNYLFARRNRGIFVLRIEDTDQSRQVEGAVDDLIDTFAALGIQFDEGPAQGGSSGPYYQSQRLTIYRVHVERLLAVGAAYPCFCSESRLKSVRETRQAEKLNTPYDRLCLSIPADESMEMMKSRPHVIRLKSPEGETITFQDDIRGTVSFQSDDIDDQVLMKRDGFPTYHFANVVDDHLMGITHVIRGEEWLPSTPKHILLYRYFDWEPPVFGHLPLLLNPDRSKLSKRQGDVAVEDYLSRGYLPDALINFVALLGWNPGDDREIFTVSQLIREFSIDRIQKSGAVFDVEKLKWMNGVYLKEMPLDQLSEVAKPYFIGAGMEIPKDEAYSRVVDFARKRISLMTELVSESAFYFVVPEFSQDDIHILRTDSSQSVLQFWADQIPKKTNWDADNIRELLLSTTETLHIKGRDLYFPLRIALYGSCHGPDIPALVDILGSEKVLIRLIRALHQ